MDCDQQTALLLQAIWRLYDGQLGRLRPAKKVPSRIGAFLAAQPSLADRQAALLGILQSIIADEAKTGKAGPRGGDRCAQ